MKEKYVMINNNGSVKVKKIVNISGSTFTDSNGNKHNEEKVMYIWKKGIPMHNLKYVSVHYLE